MKTDKEHEVAIDAWGELFHRMMREGDDYVSDDSLFIPVLDDETRERLKQELGMRCHTQEDVLRVYDDDDDDKKIKVRIF